MACRDRVLEYSSWLTWHVDMTRKPWLPWASWQIPTDSADLQFRRWTGTAYFGC